MLWLADLLLFYESKVMLERCAAERALLQGDGRETCAAEGALLQGDVREMCS